MKMLTPYTKVSALLACLLATGLIGQTAKATLAAQEPFDFATSVVAGNVTVVSGSSRTWALSTGSPNDNALVAGNLTYSGLVSPTVANNKMVSVGNVNANSDSLQETSTASSASPRYYSFLINMTTIPTVGGQVIMLEAGSAATLVTPQSTTGFTIYAKQIDATHYSFGIRAGTAALPVYEAATHLINTTNLVVVKYFNDGVSVMNDSLWVNPSSATFGGVTDPPSPTVSTGVITALWKYLILNSTANSGAGAYTFDNLRIGTTYAEVTPAAAIPPTVAYYTSIASGNWTTTNTWAYSPDGVALISPATNSPTATYPATNNVGHAVTATSAVGALALDVLGTVTMSGAGTLAVVSNLTVATGGTLDLTTTTGNTAGTVVLTGGSINGTGATLAAGNYNMPVGAANASVSANLSGGALTISEPTAALALSGTNTYSGDTIIANGTIQANGAGSLPGASNLKTGSSTANNSTLNLTTASSSYTMNKLSVGGVINFSGPSSGMATLTFTNGADITGTTGKRLNLLDSNVTVVVNGPRFDLIGPAGTSQRILTVSNQGSFIINAPMQDLSPATNSGGLSLNGEGIMILSGTNTYLGTNDINTGTLRVNGPAALSAATTLATGPSATNSTKLDLGTPGSYSANGLFLTGILRVSASGGLASLTLTGACVMAGNGSRALDAGTDATIIINQPFDLFGGTGSTTRNLNAQGSGNFVFNGSLTNGSAPGSYVCGFRKSGAGTATLNSVNSYNGSTTVLEGRVALGAGSSIANSSNIVVSAQAIFDVSALPGGFTLTAPQILGNNTDNTNVAGPGILQGSINASSGILDLAISNNLPCLNIANGTLTLSATTAINITQIGSTLPNGSYLLISKSTGGAVAGSVPTSVTVGGGGAASAATLAISGGELFLNVGGATPSPIPLSVSQAGNVLTFSWTNAAFHLQSQTNALSVGLNTNWTDYPGGGSSPALVTNNPANPAVFFRLLAP